MLLKLDAAPRRMRLVFDLTTEMRQNPRTMELAQALTLNRDRPLMGLKGTHGLYGSEEWWANIRNGAMKTKIVSGVIDGTYFAGQDSRWGDQVNSFKLKLDDETTVEESIYCHARPDQKLFKPGAVVMVAYAFDELKNQPARDGSVNYSKVVLEMAVSTD